MNVFKKIEDYTLLKKEVRDVVYVILSPTSIPHEFCSSLSHELGIISREYRKLSEQNLRLEATNRVLLEKLNDRDADKSNLVDSLYDEMIKRMIARFERDVESRYRTK